MSDLNYNGKSMLQHILYQKRCELKSKESVNELMSLSVEEKPTNK